MSAQGLNLRRARQSALLGHAGGGAGGGLAGALLPYAAALQHAGHAARPLYAQQHLGPQFAQPVRARGAARRAPRGCLPAPAVGPAQRAGRG